MSLLLDTSVVSELRKGSQANPHLRAWFHGIDDRDIHLSVLVVGEIRRAAEALRDPAGAALERWLGRLSAVHADRILPVDGRVADRWGRLLHIRSGPVVDTLMAATALVHNLVLVTRNVKDVAWTGASYLDPFAPPPVSGARKARSRTSWSQDQ